MSDAIRYGCRKILGAACSKLGSDRSGAHGHLTKECAMLRRLKKALQVFAGILAFGLLSPALPVLAQATPPQSGAASSPNAVHFSGSGL